MPFPLRVCDLKDFSAFFIAGLTSDKAFVKILTIVTYLTLVLLGVLAVYVFSVAWLACVLLHIFCWSEINLGANGASASDQDQPSLEKKPCDSFPHRRVPRGPRISARIETTNLSSGDRKELLHSGSHMELQSTVQRVEV